MKLKYLLQDVAHYTGTQVPLVRIIKATKPINNALLNFGWTNYGFDYYYRIYERFDNFLTKNNLDIKGKKILKLGSGNLPALGFLFLIRNQIDFFMSSDSYRMSHVESNSNVILLQKMIVECRNRGWNTIDELIHFENEKVCINNDRIAFSRLDITESQPIGIKYDVIVSNAVLEHVDKKGLKTAATNMNLLLNEGGVMIHEIDYRDHMNFNRPFINRKYSDKQWIKLTSGTIFYTNRLESDDFENLFRQAGFELLARQKIFHKNQRKHKENRETAAILLFKKIHNPCRAS